MWFKSIPKTVKSYGKQVKIIEQLIAKAPKALDAKPFWAILRSRASAEALGIPKVDGSRSGNGALRGPMNSKVRSAKAREGGYW